MLETFILTSGAERKRWSLVGGKATRVVPQGLKVGGLLIEGDFELSIYLSIYLDGRASRSRLYTMEHGVQGVQIMGSRWSRSILGIGKRPAIGALQ